MAMLAAMNVSQATIAKCLGVTVRAVRNLDTPRNADGSYPLLDVWKWDREVYRARDAGIDTEMKRLERELDIETKKEMLAKRRAENRARDGKLISEDEVIGFLAAVKTVTQSAGRRAEKLWGEAGRRFYADLWASVGAHFGRLVSAQDDYVLCRREGKRKRLAPVEMEETTD